ncbi:dienelactone hydrolase family protein [Rhodococcus opacus]|nr:dienelactone hydrolase family protein [Rhodococcus opacus]
MTSGSMVDLSAADGHTFRAYSVSPEVTEPVGGLVLLHEIFGINSYMRTMAEIFAGHGFHTLVPDLFARQERDVELGYSGDDFTHALELRDNLDRSTVTLDIGVASDFLRGGATSNGRVGTLGYCLGGGLAILAAAHTDVDTAVSYYGVGVQDHLDLAERINVPVLFHVAEHDHYCPRMHGPLLQRRSPGIKMSSSTGTRASDTHLRHSDGTPSTPMPPTSLSTAPCCT